MAIFTALHTLDNPTLDPSLTNHASAHKKTAQTTRSNKAEQKRTQGYKPPSTVKLLGRASFKNIARSYRLIRTLGDALPAVQRVRKGLKNKQLHWIKDKAKTRFNNTIGPHRVIERLQLSAKDIKNIRALAPGSSANDAALAIIGGALRKYLIRHNELPDTSLVASVPINARSSRKKNPRAKHKANVLSIMNCVLGTHIADAKTRMKAVYEATQESKSFADQLGPDLFNNFADALYAPIAAWGLRTLNETSLLTHLPPVTHTVVTNVPGTSTPLFLNGCKLVDSFGLGPLIPNCGLFHIVSSTYEHFSISVTADRAIMPDAALYRQCLEESLKELITASTLDEIPSLTSKNSLQQPSVPHTTEAKEYKKDKESQEYKKDQEHIAHKENPSPDTPYTSNSTANSDNSDHEASISSKTHAPQQTPLQGQAPSTATFSPDALLLETMIDDLLEDSDRGEDDSNEKFVKNLVANLMTNADPYSE